MRHSLLTALAMLLFIPPAAIGQEVREAATTTDPIPITTSSDAALEHFTAGQVALDMGRPDDARPHFEQAITADPDFALAHLYLAWASNSLEGFRKNLELASQKAASATEGERFLIEVAQKDFEEDVQGQLESARRLVEVQPNSARAWMALADAQSDMGNEEEARASLEKAIEVAPGFVLAHMALGNSYLFVEPRDLVKAQAHMEEAVELAPDEAVPHDLLGDTYRAQGQLEKAAEEYGRTAELDPESGNGYQQRGHVHSFLGDFEQARADYDAAIEIEKGKNAEATFGVFRAFVNIHEGIPDAAIDELERLVSAIDGMGIPEPRGIKIFALESIAEIALHHKKFDVARSALDRRNGLLEEQAEQMGTEAARRDAEATIALYDGILVARQGDYEAATLKANEYMSIMEPSADPEKNEPAHGLLGFVSLKQDDPEGAITHFEQADPDDIYIVYYHAKALDKAGRTDEAKRLFEKVANWNFNSVGLALVRKDAQAKLQ